MAYKYHDVVAKHSTVFPVFVFRHSPGAFETRNLLFDAEPNLCLAAVVFREKARENTPLESERPGNTHSRSESNNAAPMQVELAGGWINGAALRLIVV